MSEERGKYEVVVATTPQLSIEQAVARYNGMVAFVRTIMKDGVDFGVVPGTTKPTLLKPGAEKLCTLFKLYPRPEVIEKVLDWTGQQQGEPFFYYHTRTHLYNTDGVIVASADGSCNSMESRYRYRWVPAHELPPGTDVTLLKARGGTMTEYAFAVDKGETSGKYGKPASYWQTFRSAIAAGTAKKITKTNKSGKVSDAWEIDGTLYRVPNPDIADVANTVLKQSAKRSLVAVVLIAANASEFFTQDLDDTVIEGEFTEAESVVTVTPTASGKATAETRTPAEIYRDNLRAEAVKLENNTTLAPGLVGLLKGKVAEALQDNDENVRHLIFRWLWGKEHTDDLTTGQLRAMLNTWVSTKKDATGDNPLSDKARMQLAAIRIQAEKEAGQQTLPATQEATP